jgi:hypothetical protein
MKPKRPNSKHQQALFDARKAATTDAILAVVRDYGTQGATVRDVATATCLSIPYVTVSLQRLRNAKRLHAKLKPRSKTKRHFLP